MKTITVKTRTIHELLIALYNYITDNAIYYKNGTPFTKHTGLCFSVYMFHDRYYISEEEFNILDDFIISALPTKRDRDDYCWKQRYWTNRRKWLQKQIELTKP